MSESNGRHYAAVYEDLEPQRFFYKIKGKEYVLEEGMADVAIKFRNHVSKGIKYGSDGKPIGAVDQFDAEPYLVSLCLREVYVTSNGEEKYRPVLIDQIRTWRSEFVKELYTQAKKISRLGEYETVASLRAFCTQLEEQLAAIKEQLKLMEEAEAKNSPSATTDLSV